MKYILSAFALLAGIVGFMPSSVNAAACPLPSGYAYKTASGPAIYYVTDKCTKHLLTNEEFFSYFTNWSDTKVTTFARLSAVKDETGTFVMGPKYFPRTGSIIKTANDPAVYYVFWFSKIKIGSESLFHEMGFSWDWIETVPQATMDKFITSPEGLNTSDDVFQKGIYLFRYAAHPEKTYFLLPDFKTGKSQKHYLKNDTLIDYLGYRRDRIPTLLPFYEFPSGAEIDNIEAFFTQYVQDSFGGLFSGLGFENTFPDPLDTSTPIDEDWFNFFPEPDQTTPDTSNIDYLRVDENFDHIRGNKNAKVTLIEYADFECPFCKDFHGTMKQVMAKYGNDVRWVFRQYPLESLHKQAWTEALASECAGEQGKFWEFADNIFDKTNSNDSLNLAKLQAYAVEVGVDATTFNTCLKQEKYAVKVGEDIADAQSAGAEGTPYALLIDANGDIVPLRGALPFTEIEAEIQKVL